MFKQNLAKYEKEVGSMEPGSILKTLSEKSLGTWVSENNERVLTACLMMQELGIGNRIYEFHDANFINGRRIETFSDYLISNHEPTIVSRQLESGNFDGINIMHSRKGAYGGLFEYITEQDVKSNKAKSKKRQNEYLSYDVIDSAIFDSYEPRLIKYVLALISLGKDCYFPITGYLNSRHVEEELNKQNKIIKRVLKTPQINVTAFENTIKENNGYVKVLKIRKEIA